MSIFCLGLSCFSWFAWLQTKLNWSNVTINNNFEVNVHESFLLYLKYMPFLSNDADFVLVRKGYGDFEIRDIDLL